MERSMARGLREVIVPLCSGETYIQLWSLWHKKDMDLLELVARGGLQE